MAHGRRRDGGFTLIELAVVVVIIGVLAAAAYGIARAAFRNSGLSSSSYEVVMRLGGVRSQAMAEGRDLLFVFADAPGNDASGCEILNSTNCARTFLLAPPPPPAAFVLSSFDVANPTAMASYVEDERLGKGVRLHLAASGRPQAPFSSLVPNDPTLTTTCAGNRRCFAIRFTATGVVRAELPGGGSPTAPVLGYAFVLSGGNEAESAAALHKGVLVSFPSGIVKGYPHP